MSVWTAEEEQRSTGRSAQVEPVQAHGRTQVLERTDCGATEERTVQISESSLVSVDLGGETGDWRLETGKTGDWRLAWGGALARRVEEQRQTCFGRAINNGMFRGANSGAQRAARQSASVGAKYRCGEISSTYLWMDGLKWDVPQYKLAPQIREGLFCFSYHAKITVAKPCPLTFTARLLLSTEVVCGAITNGWIKGLPTQVAVLPLRSVRRKSYVPKQLLAQIIYS